MSFMESAKLRALLVQVPKCFACLRAHVLTCLSCSRANVSCVLTCSLANVSCMFTYSCADVPCVLTCSRANMHCVLTCSRANAPRVLFVTTCLRAHSNIFSLHFCDFSFFLFLWNKTVIYSYILLPGGSL